MKRGGMRRNGLSVTLTAGLCCALVSSCGMTSPSNADPEHLVVADFYSETHSIGEAGIQPFMEDVEERSDGDLGFDYKTSEQLVAAEDTHWAVRSGAADIGNVLYMDSQMPLMYVPQIPGQFQDDEVVAASRAFWKFMQTNDAVQDTFEEWNLHPLFCFTTTNYQMQFSDPDVGETPSSLEGESVRAAGPILPFSVEATGAVSTDLNASEAFDAFNRGVIDGVTLSVTSMRDYNYYELIESAVTNVDLGGFPVCYVMNRDAWESLDANEQEVLSDAGDAAVERTSKTLLDQVDSEIDQWRSDGIAVHEMAGSAAIDEQLAKVEDRWVDGLVSNGMDREVLEEGIAQWKRLLAKELDE